MSHAPFFFIQLSDPQLGGLARFGRATPAEGMAREIALFEEAIAEVNRLRPEFVVITGDLGDSNMDPIEIAEVKRIASGLDSGIPIYWVSGNRDMTFNGDTAKPELLARYRDEFGDDYYSFSHGGVGFIVLSSSTIYDPSEVPGEWDAQLAFVQSALRESSARGERMKIAFSHHPLFTETPLDEDSRMHLPRARREPLLELFREHGVSAVFCGHLHRNNYARDGEMEMVVTSAVGMQALASNVESGYRIVKMFDDRIEHEYFEFGGGPASVDLG